MEEACVVKERNKPYLNDSVITSSRNISICNCILNLFDFFLICSLGRVLGTHPCVKNIDICSLKLLNIYVQAEIRLSEIKRLLNDFCWEQVAGDCEIESCLATPFEALFPCSHCIALHRIALRFGATHFEPCTRWRVGSSAPRPKKSLSAGFHGSHLNRTK